MTQYEDEFHVTLPSNASLDAHPENKPSHYVTELPHSITLNGAWEVAAMEVQFTREWYNLPKSYVLGVSILNWSAVSASSSATGSSAPEFNNELDEKLNRWRQASWKGSHANKFHYRQVVVKAGHYRNLLELADHVCTLINTAFQGVTKTLNLYYDYDEGAKSVALVPGYAYIIRITALNNEFMNILGFKPNESCKLAGSGDFEKNYAFYGLEPTFRVQPDIKRDSSIITDNASPEGLADVRSIFIYSDVSGYQIVGNEKAQLIGIVPVVVKEGERTHWTFSPPYYSRVASNSFKSIRIWLTDHCGEEVKFSNTADFIVTRLHFRRCK